MVCNMYHLTIIPAIVKRYSRTSSPPALPALLAEQLTGGLFSIHPEKRSSSVITFTNAPL